MLDKDYARNKNMIFVSFFVVQFTEEYKFGTVHTLICLCLLQESEESGLLYFENLKTFPCWQISTYFRDVDF